MQGHSELRIAGFLAQAQPVGECERMHDVERMQRYEKKHHREAHLTQRADDFVHLVSPAHWCLRPSSSRDENHSGQRILIEAVQALKMALGPVRQHYQKLLRAKEAKKRQAQRRGRSERIFIEW